MKTWRAAGAPGQKQWGKGGKLARRRRAKAKNKGKWRAAGALFLQKKGIFPKIVGKVTRNCQNPWKSSQSLKTFFGILGIFIEILENALWAPLPPPPEEPEKVGGGCVSATSWLATP